MGRLGFVSSALNVVVCFVDGSHQVRFTLGIVFVGIDSRSNTSTATQASGCSAEGRTNSTKSGEMAAIRYLW